VLQGLRTVIYPVEDLARAKAWYSRTFGIQPYFDEPFYVGFNVGGYELGLDPDVEGVTRGEGPVAYWGVKDVVAAHRAALAAGAAPEGDVQDVGGGIRVATVKDPFGNVIGLIENPHFKLP